MRKLLMTLCLTFILTGSSFAGDYHNQEIRQKSGEGATLVCAQCHTMHGTQGGEGGSAYSLIYDGTVDTYPRLIREESVVSLCKYCHDGDPANIGAPDIFSPVYNASGGDYASQSGIFDKSILADNEKRHDIGVDMTGRFPPGYSGGEWGLAQERYGTVFSCIYCHDQHGNTNYRNVRPNPLNPSERDPNEGARVTYNNGLWTAPYAIAQGNIDKSGKGSNPENQFSTSNMTYRRHEDGSGVIQIAGFCGKCHVDFFGAGGDSNMGGSPTGDSGINTQWKRHPVGGIAVGIGNGHTDPEHLASIPYANRVRVINPDGLDSGGDEQPFCFTCHRAHGSTNHSNLIFGAPTSTGGSGSGIRDTCQQCHNQ